MHVILAELQRSRDHHLTGWDEVNLAKISTMNVLSPGAVLVRLGGM